MSCAATRTFARAPCHTIHCIAPDEGRPTRNGGVQALRMPCRQLRRRRCKGGVAYTFGIGCRRDDSALGSNRIHIGVPWQFRDAGSRGACSTGRVTEVHSQAPVHPCSRGGRGRVHAAGGRGPLLGLGTRPSWEQVGVTTLEMQAPQRTGKWIKHMMMSTGPRVSSAAAAAPSPQNCASPAATGMLRISAST